MNRQETRTAIIKANSIDSDLQQLYLQLHRAENYTIEEAACIEKLEYIRVQLQEVHGLLCRQFRKYEGGMY